MKTFENLSYAPNPEALLDLSLPDAENFPTLLYFHGGGLVKGDKKSASVMVPLLTANGFAVASANYRMYPDAHYPDFVEDAAAAVAYLRKELPGLGGNGRLFVGGSSAGGYLSMMLCFAPQFLGRYGIDPAEIAGYLHNAGQPTDHFRVMEELGFNRNKVAVDEKAPLYYVGDAERLAPMLFIWSDNDMVGRAEQLSLMLKTIEHFGYDMSKIETKLMHGKHCSYCAALDESGESILGRIFLDFMKRYS